MGLLEKLHDFDNQSIQVIAFNMIKWFNFDSVDISISERSNVESRVWIRVEIRKGDQQWHIDGQRNDIVHRRLAEWLKEHLEKQKEK